ncbi:MAG: saccharopine dehydrogenase NADP-binding domain-containing protein [Porticoccaceae bacterium]|nr:saccharopine dehydrogenase NADP-binding domain-containing protein [Porticoccaceae bacterium]
MDSKTLDIILFGATSFVGKITTQYLLNEVGIGKGVTWAIAGRSLGKLKHLKNQLGPEAENIPIIVADSADSASLTKMCQQGRVILSTVGPYALYGESLVEACVHNGNDYCDLTGEAYWIKKMLDKYQLRAEKTGARIINCCGFDSIPSDLGVYFLQQASQRQFGTVCKDVKLRVKAMKGGVSGGTVASGIEMAKAVKKDPTLRRKMGNPYLLCQSQSSRVKQPRILKPTFDKDFNAWSAPFIMETINSRIVLRSNNLQQHDGCEDFTYGEAVLTGKGRQGYFRAWGITLGLGGFGLAAKNKLLRFLIQKFLLPKPGQGPSPKQQENGFFDLRIIGKTNQQCLTIKVTGDKDPGYGCTAKMLTQAGLCMAFDIGKTELSGGFWTPATAMNDKLIIRLVASAGMTFDILED